MKYGGYVYILANKHLSLYTGMTNHLKKRVYEHKLGLVKGFTSRYKIDRLMHYEPYPRIEDAIKREKQLKTWKREWKIQLILKHNPELKDLFFDILD